MSGLEIAESNLETVLKNKDYRWDSDFYTTKLFYNKNLDYISIRKILTKSQYGISRSMNEQSGVPIYRMNDIHNMLCDNSVDKFVEMNVDELETFKLKDGDVLFNRTNSYQFVGRTGIYYKRKIEDMAFASYLVRFNTNPEVVLPEYLTVYLNSKFGQLDIKRRSRPSINQTNVNPEEVKEMLIPIFSMDFQERIAKKLKTAGNLIFASESIYEIAEKILLSEIGLLDYRASEDNVSIKSLKESFIGSGRLDSEYFQPKYDAIEEAIKSSRNGYDYIKNKFKLNKTKIDKFAAYEYIEIGDIDIGSGSYDSNKVDLEDLPANAKIKAFYGDLLVSTVRPNRGAVAIIDEDTENLVCSGAFTVLQETSNYSKETLFILLRTNPYKDLLLKYNSGTSYPVIKDDDVLGIVIPKIEEQIQNQVKEKVEKIKKNKEKAKILIMRSKIAVEIAIEKGEKEAINFLNEETD